MDYFIYYLLAYVGGLGFLYAFMKARSTNPPLPELLWTGILSLIVGAAGAFALDKLGLHHWVFVIAYGLVGAYFTYKFLDGKR